MGRRSQKTGQGGESIAAVQLKMMGVRMVEDIPTPIGLGDKRFFKSYAFQKGQKLLKQIPYYRIFYKKKVRGDISGVMGDGSGRSVLAEVKTVAADRLRFSALEAHQVENLNEQHELGGVALLIFLDGYGGLHVMRWPIEGFVKRTSILAKDAHHHYWDGRS